MGIEGTPLKVLIVDDEPDMETLIRQKFRKKIRDGEFEFVFARHGEEALERLQSDPALNIVLSDLNMPVMDGLTLLSRLSEVKRILKTVIVSAYGDMRNIRIAMNRGAYDFLTKPIDFDDLELTLRKTMLELHTVKEGLNAREHLNATLNVVADLSSELKLGPLLEKIIATITKMLQAERSTLFLYDDKKNELYTEFGEGLGKSQIRIAANNGIAGAAFMTSESIRIDNPYSDPRFNTEVDQRTGFLTRSLLCVPVVNKQGRTIGVTQALNKIDGAFTDNDEMRLRAFTSQISIALENAKLFSDVQAIKNYNESILESMASGVVTLDDEGKMVTCNAAARQIMKVGDDILGKSASDVFTGSSSWVLERLNDLAANNTNNVTMDAQMEFAGEKISANVTILPLTDMQAESGSMIMIEDITTEKRLKSTMSRYIDPSVVEKLLESNQQVLGGQSSLATILFSDIRNFTGITEEFGAQDTVALLNGFFTVMVDCVQREGGMLDKFIGDAFMAEFGIPLDHPDDDDRAVRAAILMHTELRIFNESRIGSGRPPLHIGVGINSAHVVSGNIGSPKRMDYTVIGDGVNIASRIEGACKEYGAGILISDTTFAGLRSKYRSREIDRVLFRGKSTPVSVFEILDHHTEEEFPNMTAVLASFSEGLHFYRNRKWNDAIGAFENAVRLNPSDRASVNYLKRCEHLKNNPPAEGWTGVWVMTSK